MTIQGVANIARANHVVMAYNVNLGKWRILGPRGEEFVEYFRGESDEKETCDKLLRAIERRKK